MVSRANIQLKLILFITSSRKFARETGFVFLMRMDGDEEQTANTIQCYYVDSDTCCFARSCFCTITVKVHDGKANSILVLLCVVLSYKYPETFTKIPRGPWTRFKEHLVQAFHALTFFNRYKVKKFGRQGHFQEGITVKEVHKINLDSWKIMIR